MTATRWQPPKLHQHREGHAERKVTWLELFYDLVYVATIIQLGNVLSSNVSLAGFLGFVALFIPIWWSWSGTTFFFNRIIADDIWHRLLIFSQMFAIAVLAISVSGAIGDRSGQFALTYVAIRAVLILLYYHAGRHIPSAHPLTTRYTLGFGLAALVWLVSVFVPTPLRYWLWGVGMVIDFAVPLSSGTRRLNKLLPPDLEHMSERYGLLTIIVLGEAFVKVIGSAAEEQLGLMALVYGFLGLVIACSLWWLYFDKVAGSVNSPLGLAPYVWIYSHLPLTLGLTAYGVGIKKLVVLHQGDPLADKYRWLICGAVALALAFTTLIDLATIASSRSSGSGIRSMFRFGSVAAILLLALVGGLLSPVIFIALLALICVAQIVLDLVLEARGSLGPVGEHTTKHVFEASAHPER